MLNVTTQIISKDNSINTLEQYLEEPSLEEVKIAIKFFKRGKAPGEDLIISELFKKRIKCSNNKLKTADK